MNKKILVVGGVAGGASTAARLRRISEDYEIIMFERGPHVSFSNCALPYYLGGAVEEVDDLLMVTPEEFWGRFRIDVRVKNEVVEIDRENKEVVVKNLEDGTTYRESYDKLVLSPGANPIVPPFEGMDEVDLFTVRNVVDIVKLDDFIKENDVKKVSVIGGGFIGVEVAENLKIAGYDVTLLEALDQIMQPFDYDMVQILHKEMYDNGIDLKLGDPVAGFEKDTVVLKSGEKVETDMVVMAIGVSPDTKLAEDAGLEIGETRAIKVNHNYQTNDEDIYAIGDAIQVFNKLMEGDSRLALAGPAQKQAIGVADHISGGEVRNTGVIGSSVIKIFDMNGASTGLNEGQIKKFDLGLDYEVVRVIPDDKVGIMPDAEPLHFKLIFEVPTGRILGAQAIGKGNVDKRIDVIATAIKYNGTVEDLAELELTYAPPFGTAKDVVNHAGLVALNVMREKYKQLPVTEFRRLVEEDAFILDVRVQEQYDAGHLVNSVHIPFHEVRDRLDELPGKDEEIYVHCRSGQYSYFVTKMLTNMGYKKVYNLAGGLLGASYYEYFTDKTTGREPIVTDYIFE